MKLNYFAVTLTASLALAACGGGGGGSPSVVSANPVVITDTNAKAISANALHEVSSTVTQQSSGAVLTSNDADHASLMALGLSNVQTARSLATSVTVPAYTKTCAAGGTVTVSGTMDNPNMMTAGDALNATFNNCKTTANGITTTMNGSEALVVVSLSGSSTAYPYSTVWSLTVNNLSRFDGTLNTTVTGDVRLEMTMTSATVDSMKVSGSSLNTTYTQSGKTRVSNWINYTQTAAISGSSASTALAATIKSDSTALGAAGGTYTLTTPTPWTRNTTTGVVSAGVVKVVGANNSQVLVTAGANNTLTLQIDANGDGVYEKTQTTTLTELNTLL